MIEINPFKKKEKEIDKLNELNRKKNVKVIRTLNVISSEDMTRRIGRAIGVL